MEVIAMTTKKFVLPVLAASVFAFGAQAATAQDMNSQHEYTYLGLEAQSVDFDGANSSSDEYGALNLSAGIRADRHLVFELGYFVTEEKSNPANTVDFYAHGVTADVIGYLPLTDDDKFELFGNVGAAFTMYELDTAAGDETESDLNIRFGGGAQYHINNDWSARARFTHTESSQSGVDDYQTVSVGVAYKF
jgi:opacity protein-like surface antigen